MMPHQIANRPLFIPGITPPQMTYVGAPAEPAPRLIAQMDYAPPPALVADWDEDCEDGAAACARPGFEWHAHGLAVWVRAENGTPVRIFFPLPQVDIVYQRETARVGCPLDPTVGDYSVGGFFKKLGKGLKKFHDIATLKFARKAIGKGIKKVMSKSKFGRALWKAGDKIYKVAQKVKEVGKKIIRSKPFRAALAIAGTAFPVIAPGVAALEAAQQIMDRVEKAKKIAQKVKAGLEHPGRAASIIAEGARAAGIAGQALDAAKAGSRDGAELMGAMKHIDRLSDSPIGRIARRATPALTKAATRARVVARRKRAHARAA